MNRFAIIVAAGSGHRFGGTIPKQFLELCNKPVLMHSIEKFFSVEEIILVLPEEFIEYWKELCNKYSFNLNHKIVKGGATRTESVQNGLREINSDGIVAIHDGVRPLVSNKLIEKLFLVAEEKGNAVPVIEIQHSLRMIENNSNHSVDRNKFRLVQTPQCFNIRELKEAYENISNEQYTDDASVYEASDNAIALVEGEKTNIKITGKDDLTWAETLIKTGIVTNN